MLRNFVIVLAFTCFEIGALPFLPDAKHGENLKAIIFLQPNISTINGTSQNESMIEVFVKKSKTGEEDGNVIYVRQGDEGEGVELPAILGGGGGAELFTQLGQLFNAIFAGGLRSVIQQNIAQSGISFGSLFGRTTTTTTTTTTAKAPTQAVKNPVRRKPTVRTTAPPVIDEDYLNEIQVPVTSAKAQIRTTVKRRVIKTTLPPDNFEEY